MFQLEYEIYRTKELSDYNNLFNLTKHNYITQNLKHKARQNFIFIYGLNKRDSIYLQNTHYLLIRQ